MRTCSSLTRNCAYVTKLSKLRKRPKATEIAAEEGTRFGALVQAWIEGREESEPEERTAPWEWYEEFRSQFKAPPPGTRCEVAMGLSPAGEFVPVHEPEPHWYVPLIEGQQIVTAGRLDLGWINGNVGVVLDLKRSGWRYGDPELVPQFMALGIMWARMHCLDWLQLGLYGARDTGFVWSPEIQRVDDLVPEVLAMCALPEETPIPGDHCGACYEKKGCPEGMKFLNA